MTILTACGYQSNRLFLSSRSEDNKKGTRSNEKPDKVEEERPPAAESNDGGGTVYLRERVAEVAREFQLARHSGGV